MPKISPEMTMQDIAAQVPPSDEPPPVIDLERGRVRRGEQVVKLTRTEFDILRCLARGAGQIVPQADLMREVWGATKEANLVNLKVQIRGLRRKIEVDPEHPRRVLSQRGQGYRLVEGGG